MFIIPKHKLGTTVAIDKEKVLDYFEVYIDKKNEDTVKESYNCKDGSVIILRPSNIESKVFVKFHLNPQIDTIKRSVGYIELILIMKFCKENNSEIQNLRTGVVMPVSEGAIMSDIFTSEAHRIARHYANHPKDRQNTKSK